MILKLIKKAKNTQLKERYLKRHNQIKKLIDIYKEIYYCHFFPHFPDISLLNFSNSGDFLYILERIKMMNFFLNKIQTYFFIKNDTSYKKFFERDYLNKIKPSFYENTMKILKKMKKSAKTSITDRIKNSFKKSINFLNPKKPAKSKTLSQNEQKLEDKLNYLEEILTEIESINKILRQNTDKQNNSYIINNIEDFSFHKEYKLFSEITYKMKEKEISCLKKVERTIIFKLKDLREDLEFGLFQVREKINAENGFEGKREFQKEFEVRDRETFLRELERFVGFYDKNVKGILENYWSETNDLENIEVDLED